MCLRWRGGCGFQPHEWNCKPKVPQFNLLLLLTQVIYNGPEGGNGKCDIDCVPCGLLAPFTPQMHMCLIKTCARTHTHTHICFIIFSRYGFFFYLFKGIRWSGRIRVLICHSFRFDGRVVDEWHYRSTEDGFNTNKLWMLREVYVSMTLSWSKKWQCLMHFLGVHLWQQNAWKCNFKKRPSMDLFLISTEGFSAAEVIEVDLESIEWDSTTYVFVVWTNIKIYFHDFQQKKQTNVKLLLYMLH